MAIEVTCRDTETGDTETIVLQPGQYVVTCAEPVYEVEVELRGVRYALTRSTREALIALGWTPPKEAT
jgi:hypothetical protein